MFLIIICIIVFPLLFFEYISLILCSICNDKDKERDDINE